MSIVCDILSGIKYVLVFMFSNAFIIFTINKLKPLPKEVFRKLFHFIAFSSIIVMIYTAKEWVAAVIIPDLMILLMMPVLEIASRNDKFTKMMSERRPGELRSSLVQLFGTMTIIIFVFWGLFDHKELTVAAILMWGFGDATAALIGKKYGKHKVLRFKHVDHKKSWEGTASMSIVAFIFGLASLLLVSDFSLEQCIVPIAVAAPLASLTELFTGKGYDTVTVPFISAFSIYGMYLLMGIA